MTGLPKKRLRQSFKRRGIKKSDKTALDILKEYIEPGVDWRTSLDICVDELEPHERAEHRHALMCLCSDEFFGTQDNEREVTLH